jgi:hypothetical protein
LAALSGGHSTQTGRTPQRRGYAIELDPGYVDTAIASGNE